MGVEEEYQDVMQNIESAIVGVYRDHPELADFQVDQALEAPWMLPLCTAASARCLTIA